MVYINDGKNIIQVPRGTSILGVQNQNSEPWKNSVTGHDFKNDPEKPNHLFNFRRPFKGKDDVRQLNYLLSKLKGHYGSGDSESGNRKPMRVVYHSGRKNKDSIKVYSAKHNDRNFDSQSEHIVRDKTGANITWNWCGDEFTFDEGEQKFYEMVFSEQLNESNEKYLKRRHPERVKTMEEWRKCPLHAPEETIIQYGRMGHHPDVETSVKCFKEFMTWLDDWNNKNGHPFKVLNWAFHQDEQGAPHFHLRKVWYYLDMEKKYCTTGQGEALRRTFLDLPNPEKKEGQKNNRKITFDKMCRQKLIEIGRAYGLNIEDKPKPREEVGLTLEEYKRRQDQEQQEVFKDLVQFAELNVAMAEKVSDWEEVAKTADKADAFLERMVDKAYHAFDEDKRKSVVEEIKAFYAGEAKKREDEHKKVIAGYRRLLNPSTFEKKDRDWDIER